MRGGDERSGSLFSYVDLEARVDKDHPLRTIRLVVNAAAPSVASTSSAAPRTRRRRSRLRACTGTWRRPPSGVEGRMHGSKLKLSLSSC